MDRAQLIVTLKPGADSASRSAVAAFISKNADVARVEVASGIVSGDAEAKFQALVNQRQGVLLELTGISQYVDRLIERGRVLEAASDDVHVKEMCWKSVFETTFSDHVSGEAKRLFGELRQQFEYNDPDTSYKDDVLAYADALREAVKQVVT